MDPNTISLLILALLGMVTVGAVTFGAAVTGTLVGHMIVARAKRATEEPKSASEDPQANALSNLFGGREVPIIFQRPPGGEKEDPAMDSGSSKPQLGKGLYV